MAAEITVTPDQIVFFEMGPLTVTGTIFYTWIVMVIMLAGALVLRWLLRPEPPYSRGQMFLEALIQVMREQGRDVMRRRPERYLPFIGTLLLFVSLSNFLDIGPGFHAPTASLYTTGALAVIVFFAVPYFSITTDGLREYLKNYLRPTPIILPFTVISEFSRALALAVRLFGNVMSTSMIVAVLLSIAPFFLPVVMEALGLLLGQIHAYIFALLAMIYIATGLSPESEEGDGKTEHARSY
jgi:F-type H+-transporting ATPase subunit a